MLSNIAFIKYWICNKTRETRKVNKEVRRGSITIFVISIPPIVSTNDVSPSNKQFLSVNVEYQGNGFPMSLNIAATSVNLQNSCIDSFI